MDKKEIKDSIEETKYVGNVFGPKLTLYGGLIILFFLGLMVYRHWSMGIPFRMEAPVETEEVEVKE